MPSKPKQRVIQQELFPMLPKRERIFFKRGPGRSVKVSSLVNKYAAKLMLALERAQKIDRLRAVLKELKPLERRAGFLHNALFRKRNSLRREVRAFFARLERLGMSRDEINTMLRKRTLAVSMLEKDINSKIKELCDTPERQRRLEEIKREVKTWNFINPADKADVNFHALIEVRGLQLQHKW